MTTIRVIIILAFISCNNNIQKDQIKEAESHMQQEGYDLSKPSKVYTMPDELNEISGLTRISESKFACIEDQHGKIYIYNSAEKKVENVIDFGSKGDYEDIIKHGGSYFILRSDGVVFKYSQGKTEEFPTKLNASNNPEGLCYDPVSNSILIVCKDDGGNNFGPHEKTIYSFSLRDYKLSDKPFMVLDVNKVDQFINTKGKSKEFSPSGIAVHPVTKNIFIIAARGSGMVELDRKGNIVNANKLKNKFFIQPEGITFADNGNLFISNEGKSEKGNILEFKYQ